MRVTVVGAGNTGLAMAAHLALGGSEVVVYDRSPDVVSAINETNTIHCNGVFNDDANIAFASQNMAEATKDTDLIMIMTPAFAHKDLAILLGQSLEKEVPIILNPGRTCGAVEFTHYFSQENKYLRPLVAETQTVIHTARRNSLNSVNLIAIKDSVDIATLDSTKINDVMSVIPEAIRKHFSPAKSVVETSIGNTGMILHCTPLLLNSGWTESPKFGYKHYWEGISPRIARFLEKIDSERLAVAKALGSDLLSTKDWIKRSYHSEGDTLYDCIQNTVAYEIIDAPSTLDHRYIFEDIPYGLVPLEVIGKQLGVEMSYTSLIIDLACALMETDLRKSGRNLNHLALQSIKDGIC